VTLVFIAIHCTSSALASYPVGLQQLCNALSGKEIRRDDFSITHKRAVDAKDILSAKAKNQDSLSGFSWR